MHWSEIVIFLLMIIGVGIALIYFNVFISNLKADIERTKTPLLTVRCGANSSLFSVSYPFVRLSCYDDFLVVRFLLKIVIFYIKIKEIYLRKKLFWFRVEIIYRANLYDEKIILVFLKREDALKIFNFLNSKTKEVKVAE